MVISHRKRLLVNTVVNGRLARQRHDTRLMIPPIVPKGPMANMPQAMHVWPGLKLQVCVKEREENVVNGLEYEVMSVDDQTVRLRQLHPCGDPDKHGAPFELPHAQAALKMRLQHALCYYTAQGRTLRDGLVLCTDTDHKTFTRRHLITGIGRVGEGREMEIM